jgi:hypothetical protein
MNHRRQQAIALQPPNIQRPHVACRVFPALSAPTAKAAHDFFPSEICRNDLASLRYRFRRFLPNPLPLLAFSQF